MRDHFWRCLSVGVCIITLVLSPLSLHAKTVEELRQELESKRANLKDSEAKMAEFKANIQLKQKQARTLAEQIGLMDDSIQEIQLEINQTVSQVEETNSEIDSVSADIAQREEEITAAKGRLSDYLKAIHTLDQQSDVSIFLKYNTFSEALSETATVETLQNRAQQTLVAIQQLRDDLATKQRELEDYKQTLEALQNREEAQQTTLQSQKDSKQRILELTNDQEKQYQKLLKDAQASQIAAEKDMSLLNDAIREELKKQGINNLPSVGKFDWPVDPIFGVSCEFHCPNYPFAYLIGPHTGMDIPTYVGTPIKAPADGYVAKVHDSGGPGYSYIMLLHGDNISTVYGHVSGFAVNEGQMVSRGTVIGYSGGAPGTHGSGLSSGPHLHFEVRLNNIPVNPRNYL